MTDTINNARHFTKVHSGTVLSICANNMTQGYSGYCAERESGGTPHCNAVCSYWQGKAGLDSTS